jgi:hypothetical protein
LEVEEEARPDFPCPYCYEDFDIGSLCSHLEDEHSSESKVAVRSFLLFVLSGRWNDTSFVPVYALAFGFCFIIRLWISCVKILSFFPFWERGDRRLLQERVLIFTLMGMSDTRYLSNPSFLLQWLGFLVLWLYNFSLLKRPCSRKKSRGWKYETFDFVIANFMHINVGRALVSPHVFCN